MRSPRTVPARWLFPFTAALLLATSASCLRHDFTAEKPDPPNASTAQLLEQLARERAAAKLPAAGLVPDLRPIALRGAVSVARGDASLATAAHTAALSGVQAMGRHIWTFATDCADLNQLHLPPVTVESRNLLVNAAAVAGVGGRTFVLIVVAEPGSSSLRAEQMGGGGGGTNPSLETYVHPATAPGRCGERWPAASTRPI
ncbi:MAG TPA: hypothetical protein VHU40_02430 [Polyangia bacterium]|nr:hypothetical protein [Polyangia bacterium]